MLKFIFFISIICSCCQAADRLVIPQELVQKVVLLGYRMQYVTMNDKGGSVYSNVLVKKEYDEIKALPDSDKTSALLLLSLFDPEVLDKANVIQAWETLTMKDAPMARVFLDSREILGFKKEWSVIIANGNLEEKTIGKEKVLVCDELLSVRYVNYLFLDKRPYQYLI